MALSPRHLHLSGTTLQHRTCVFSVDLLPWAEIVEFPNFVTLIPMLEYTPAITQMC